MVRHLHGIKDISSFVKDFLEKEENIILDSLFKDEVKAYDAIKKSHLKKIDPINKKPLSFPKSLYPGKNIPLEWWYFTGHLESGKRKFGFEYCIFKFHPQELRLGILPLSYLRKEPFLVIHYAITDKDNKKFNFFQDSGLVHKEKISYTNLDLSLNNASLKLSDKFIIDSDNISLQLKPMKKMVKHFDGGFAMLYSPPPHRTYYLSFSRLETTGTIKLDDKSYSVSGLSWFDHQKSNIQNDSPIKGWDWFSVIFDDDTELMFVFIRDKKGLSPKYRVGTYIHKDSKLTGLNAKDVKIKKTSDWKSPKTGVVYPSSWTMDIPKLKMKLKITPCVKDQELESRSTALISYWEGACDVTGTKSSKKISGKSYVELVGYDKRLLSNLMRRSTV